MRWKVPLHRNIKKISKAGRKLLEDNTQQRYAEESIPSAVYESVAASSFGMNYDKFILTDEQSNKVFHIPTGTTSEEILKSNMHHNLR